jgi:glutaredoxin
MFPSPVKEGYTIFSKTGCTYCEFVKELLEDEAVTIINCDTFLGEEKAAFLDYVDKLVGKPHKTFPMVFYEGHFLGGFTETKKFYDTKNLKKDAGTE